MNEQMKKYDFEACSNSERLHFAQIKPPTNLTLMAGCFLAMHP